MATKKTEKKTEAAEVSVAEVKKVAKPVAKAKAEKATKAVAKSAEKAVEAKAEKVAEAKPAKVKKTAKAEVAETAEKADKVVSKVAKKPTAAALNAAKAAPAKKRATKASAKAESEVEVAPAAKPATKKSTKATASAAEKPAAKSATRKRTAVAAKSAVKSKKAAVKDDEPSLFDDQSFDPEYLVLMQKDPNWMQAFWEVSEKRLQRAKSGKGKLVIRLFDVANDLTVKRHKKLKFHDIVVPADARSWYIENKSSENCVAALGIVSGNNFESLVETGPMETFSLEGSDVNVDDVFVRASLGGATLGGFGSSGLSSMSAKNWLESLSSSSGSMFSGALSSAALKSNKLELPKDSVNYGKDFFLWVKTRLIVYGGTRPDAHLQVRGEPFPLNPDGTFSFEEDLPDCTKVIPVFATDKDGDFPTTIVPIVVKRTE